jgi:hypothetical protein
MGTRGTFGTAVALLLVAGMLVAVRPLDARAIGGLNTVTVSPSHGKAAVPFQVTYTISPCLAAVGLTITFSWGALAPAGQVLGTAATDSGCRATLSTTPPVIATSHQPPAPGSYLVFGYVALPTGTPTPNTEASASYTVDVAPTPTATAHASATATSSATSKPSASATNGSAASATASAPAASSQPSTATSVGPGEIAVARPTAKPGAWTLSWLVILGLAVLALAILAAILLLIGWLLRRRRARAGLDTDQAA